MTRRRFRMIPLKQRRIARQIARDAWIESGNELAPSEELFKAKGPAYGLDPATILALLQIALLLWEWWSKRNVSEPSVVASSDEPIDWDDDFNADED